MLGQIPLQPQGKRSRIGLSPWLLAMAGTQLQGEKSPCFSLPSCLGKVGFGAHVTRVALLVSLKWLTFTNCFVRNSPKRPLAGPRIRSLHSMLFGYNTDEMLKELTSSMFLFSPQYAGRKASGLYMGHSLSVICTT